MYRTVYINISFLNAPALYHNSFNRTLVLPSFLLNGFWLMFPYTIVNVLVKLCHGV